MALDQAFVGRAYPPTAPYEVSREKLREFAEAIGDDHPAYRDPEAARALGHPDVIAPPTFTILISLPHVERVVRDPELGLDWDRVVHAEQRFAHTRPVQAGDRLRVVVTVEAVRSVGGHDMVTLRADLDTDEGEHVATSTAVLVARGESA